MSGGSAAAVEYLVFLMINSTGMVHVLVANALSFLCGLTISFSLNKYWVFKSEKPASAEFTKYFALAAINLGVSTLLIGLLVNVANIMPLIAKPMTIILIALWNYVIFSKYIFKN
jgi:putative flippase GtrA